MCMWAPFVHGVASPCSYKRTQARTHSRSHTCAVYRPHVRMYICCSAVCGQLRVQVNGRQMPRPRAHGIGHGWLHGLGFFLLYSLHLEVAATKRREREREGKKLLLHRAGLKCSHTHTWVHLMLHYNGRGEFRYVATRSGMAMQNLIFLVLETLKKMRGADKSEEK